MNVHISLFMHTISTVILTYNDMLSASETKASGESKSKDRQRSLIRSAPVSRPVMINIEFQYYTITNQLQISKAASV